MPILFPSLQNFLLTNPINQKNEKEGFAFFFKYLRIASRHIYTNSTTLEASIRFKKDLQASLYFINEKFGCNLTVEDDIFNSKIKDYYTLLFKHIRYPNKIKESTKCIGNYFQILELQLIFFRPYIPLYEYHTWYFTNTPIAILCIDSAKFIGLDDKTIQQIFNFIKLEIDLMEAAGLMLVLCYNGQINIDKFMYKIIIDDQFAELHINIYNEKNIYLNFLYNRCYHKPDHFKGFIYFYSCFFDQDEKQSEWIFSQTKVFPFSISPKKAFIKVTASKISPFAYCKTGFDYEYLRIFTCYVPIYKYKLNDFDYVFKDITNCLISKDDFLIENMERHVPIMFCSFFKDEFKYNISFEDIHYLKPDFFVNNTLALANISKKTHKQIKEIKTAVDQFFEKYSNDELEKQISDLCKNIKKKNYFIKSIIDIICIYTYQMKTQSNIPNFSIRQTQIYAVLESYKTSFPEVLFDEEDINEKNETSDTEEEEEEKDILVKKNEMKKKKLKKNKKIDTNNGVIYQISTGEGKTCIISLIAASIAKTSKMNVHIVSSNMELCNRDYQKSFDFFNQLGLKTGVLLHQNELPYYRKNSSINIELDEADEKLKKKYYVNEEDEDISQNYYTKEKFNNSSDMNFCVCGINNDGRENKNKAKIVFSTFVNFECYYMFLMENCQKYIDDYYSNCILLIDEADSILIDEITTGTIISREIKSNAKKVLSKVYKFKDEGKNASETLDLLKKDPLCAEIELNDVEQMFKEIDKVNSENFCKGNMYCIEPIPVTNKKKFFHFVKKKIKLIKKAPKIIVQEIKSSWDDKVKKPLNHSFGQKNIHKGKEEKKVEVKEEEEVIEEEEEEEEEQVYAEKVVLNQVENEEEDKMEKEIFEQAIPFDNRNKGIIEKNKEFGGFIPQFISIKEREEHPNIIFKDISINYLYVSHPIYAKIYKKICGFTGTVGDKKDKNILLNQYNLITKEVPQYLPNMRIDIPTTVFGDTNKRNEAILLEILKFYKVGNPVLVICKDINDLYGIYNDIKVKINDKEYADICKSIDEIPILFFDGKDDLIRPDFISGLKRSVTFGTNICGRGTDIICSDGFALHVIISYYSDNSRVMQQAFGRTARNGHVGTCHCICTSDTFNNSTLLTSKLIDTSIQKDLFKVEQQHKYIEEIKNNHNWIFDYIKDQKFERLEDFKHLRKTRINVNRATAYNYRYPICMTCNTFITIQVQKIYSLFNCPNCVYTWRLFQRHMRELVLQSWFILIHRFEQRHGSNIDLETYKKDLLNDIETLKKRINVYLPPEPMDFISVFHHICKRVKKKYKNIILDSMGTVLDIDKKKMEFKNLYAKFNKIGSTVFQIGFKPYSLLSESGARITYSNANKMNFIQDPELHYMKKLPKGKFKMISITERVDDLINYMLQIVNGFISDKFFVKIFVRRTLAGCEIGFCLDLCLRNKNLSNNPYILIDKDPLLILSIFVWSAKPLLAGILVCVIIYLAILVKKNYSFPPKITLDKIKELLHKLAKKMCKKVANKAIDKLVGFLENILEKQLKKYDDAFTKTIKCLKAIIEKINFGKTKAAKKMNSFIGSIEISPKFFEFLKETNISAKAIYGGLLLILCLITFLRNFAHTLSIKNKCKKEALKYDSTFDNPNVNQESNKVEEIEKIAIDNENDVEKRMVKIDEKNTEEEDDDDDDSKINEELMKTKYFGFFKKKIEKMKNGEKTDELSELDFEFTISEINPISKKYVLHLPTNKKCFQVFFNPFKNRYWDAISIYSKESHPVITPFVGFVLNFNQSFMMFDTKSLDSYVKVLKQKFKNNYSKFEFLYGIACGMEFLHSKNIVYHHFNPKNIFIDSKYYPLILGFEPRGNEIDPDFADSKTFQLEDNCVEEEEIVETNIDDNLEFWKKANVYSFGKIYKKFFYYKDKEYKFDDNLIAQCCKDDPDERITFSQICDIFETYFEENNFEFRDYILDLKNKRINSNSNK